MPRPPLRGFRLLFVVAFLAATAFAASPVRAATPVDTSAMAFTATRAAGLALVPGQDFTLQLRKWTGTGPLDMFAEVVGGTANSLGTPTFTPSGSMNGEPAFSAMVTVSNPTSGHHIYRAIFDADGTYDAVTVTLEVDVDPEPTSVSIQASVNPVQTNHTSTLSAQIDGGNAGTPLTGSLEWRNADTAAVLQTDDVEVDQTYPATPTTVGIKHYEAEYSGDTTHEGSTSAVFDLTATNDFVQATGVTIDVATFYPVRDGYRDYVHAKGNRLEPVSVRILIYNSSNRIVRTLTLARAAGGYSITWNGRSTSGALQPAGRYKIVQQLTDAANMKLTVSKYVTLSLKKLVYSTKYVTKNGSAITAAGHVGNGSIAVSSTGIARLRASSGGWAGAGYQFSLPSAITYRSIAFQAYVKSALSVPPNTIGIQNFNTCSVSSGWNQGCFDHIAGIGTSSGSLVWKTSTGSATNNRSGRTARGMVSVYYGTVYVYKVRIKVVIGVLQ